MKRFVIGCAAVLPLLSFAVESAVFRLPESVPVPLNVTGVVEYSRTTIVSFEPKGRIRYVAQPGSFVVGEVLNVDGTVRRRGTLLAAQNTDIPKSDVAIAEIQHRRANVVLSDCTRTFLRDKALSEKNAVSLSSFQESETSYNTATVDYDKSKLDLQRARQVLEACYIYAPYSGVVIEAYASPGIAVDVGDPVLKIGMTDPIRIRVELPEAIRPFATSATRIQVFPNNGEEPVAGWPEGPQLNADEMVCFVANPRVSDPVLLPDGRPVSTVDDLSPVQHRPLYPEAPLWIAEQALKGDEQSGYFVWRLVPQAEPNLGFYQIDRVAVKATGEQIACGSLRLRGIEKNTALACGELLAADVPGSVKPGDLVAYQRRRFLFPIGAQVRVMLTGGYNTHLFEVPANLLTGTAERPLVRLRRDGKSVELPVAVMDREGERVRISSPRLAPGMELEVPTAQ